MNTKNEQVEIETKRIQYLLDLYDNCTDISNMLDLLYERISNREDKDYEKTYSLLYIFKSKIIKQFRKKKLRDNKSVYICIKQYSNAPKEILIEYNEFVGKSGIPTKWECFILKGE